MLNKIKSLFFDIIGDFESCWNFATVIIDNPPINKRILILIVCVILTIPILINPDPYTLPLIYIKIFFISVTTFISLAWSNTFWFLMKKSWMYKIHVKRRKSINYYLKNIKTLKIDDAESENPEGALHVISHYNSVGFKYHAFRNGAEVGVLLIILLFALPNFFLFNLALFCMQFFYVMFFDNQSSSQVVGDLKTLVFCVQKLYKNNPEDCEKLIFENEMESVRELGAIYRAVDLANK